MQMSTIEEKKAGISRLEHEIIRLRAEVNDQILQHNRNSDWHKKLDAAKIAFETATAAVKSLTEAKYPTDAAGNALMHQSKFTVGLFDAWSELEMAWRKCDVR